MLICGLMVIQKCFVNSEITVKMVVLIIVVGNILALDFSKMVCVIVNQRQMVENSA